MKKYDWIGFVVLAILILVLIGLGLRSKDYFIVNRTVVIRNDDDPLVVKNKTVELADISCDTVTAYFNGTFQRADLPGSYFDAQFQIKLKVGKNEPKYIWFQVEHWNGDFLKEEDAFFRIWHNGTTRDCYIKDKHCWLFRVSKKTQLMINIWTYNSDWYTVRVLDFEQFFNSFSFKQAFGQCTNQKLIEAKYAPNAYLYDYCVCCGDYYNPHPKMKCPKSPWA